MRLEEAQRLYAEMKKCNACVMRKGCQQVVTHDGFLDDTPLLLIVGEAPGVDEDTQGIPFVGDCGQLLREALRATKSLNKNNTIISNTLKCRPIGNKFPKVKEIPRLCVATWLDKEIELIEPKRMLLLGNVPLQYVAGFTGITRARGKGGRTPTERHDRTERGEREDGQEGSMRPYKGAWTPSPGFDASGSAIVSFFGKPAMVDVHWQKIGVPLGRLVCPRTIDVAKSECWLCKRREDEKSTPPTNDGQRVLSLIYDWGLKKFGTFVMTKNVMLEIINVLTSKGFDTQMIEMGNGPRFGLQRTQDKQTLVTLMDVMVIPKELPSQEDMLARSEQESAYAQDESKFLMGESGKRGSWGKDDPKDRWSFV